MEKPKRTYANAGGQKQQGWSEVHRYAEFGPDRLVTVQCIAMVLGIRLQMVKQIPVERRVIDKRVYYRKGDIDAWLIEDLARPDSLARQLRAQHAESLKRMARQPSRKYSRGQMSREESAQAKAANAVLVQSPLTIDETHAGWDRRFAKRQNSPLLGPPILTEADAQAAEFMAAYVREELKKGS